MKDFKMVDLYEMFSDRIKIFINLSDNIIIMDNLTKVSFTNLEKILFPGLDLKKSRVIEYYIRIAPLMLGLLKNRVIAVSYTHLRAHETRHDLVCRLLLEKKKNINI